LKTRKTIQEFQNRSDSGEKIVMITAYDYTSAKIIESAGIDYILVGDSLGQVVLGYDSTVEVSIEDILHHLKAVSRGTERAHIVADMPFMTFQINPECAVSNAGKLLQIGGAQSVKIEGGKNVCPTIRKIVDSGIPVMGHLGLTPQSHNQLGGYHLQAKTLKTAEKIIEDALAVESAGAFSLVLESIPSEVAKIITAQLKIPTIGIGAGPYCNGQIQVFHDLMGLFSDFQPKHTKKYADLSEIIKESISRYSMEVKEGAFPTIKNSFKATTDLISELEAKLDLR
jgi:3-methyl-2-oxobutanoate hydroxymethyltransferase